MGFIRRGGFFKGVVSRSSPSSEPPSRASSVQLADDQHIELPDNFILEGPSADHNSAPGNTNSLDGSFTNNVVSVESSLDPALVGHPRAQTRHYISVGPFGGGVGGSEFDDGIYNTVKQVIISYGGAINRIQIEYDQNGIGVWGEEHGGDPGRHTVGIVLDYPNEFLISASGHSSKFNLIPDSTIIRSLTLQSNTTTYGPFGWQEGSFFAFPANSGKIVGFFGRSGLFLDTIGAHMEPLP